jgi:putative peptide zinc metalloprotease protein
VRLAALRDELGLHPGPRDASGAPTWTLSDPARGRYFRVGWREFEMLCRWRLEDPAAVAEAVTRETPLEVEPEDVVAFARFLSANNLLRSRGEAGIELLRRQTQAARKHWSMWLLKNYLFFRIPLVRPNAFLHRTLPRASALWGRGFVLATVLAALLGLYLVTRQWETFLASFPWIFTLEGAAMTGGALLMAKVIHELGHGYAAARFGCRVPTMGVAFMVLWPVLFTDTSDAWTLRSRRQRLTIGAAGMGAELMLAAWATLAWSFLPDGPLRSAAFLLATSTWILTLLVNLNPLMRFDGYYLLSDALDVANLQDRAFALARWRLREALFGLGEPPPEEFPARRRRALLAYAYATWVYRFFLFLGIALLVYHLFFKLLGVLLFAVEIVWFILRPAWSELREWAARRRAMRANRRSLATLALAALGAGLLLVPWRGTVEAPALWRAERESHVYAPVAARIEAIPARPGERVAEGQELFRLASPDLAHKAAQARRRVETLRWQVQAQSLDREIAQRSQVLWSELAGAQAELAGLEAETGRLVVRAPVAGVVVELEEPLAAGDWVAKGERLGLVAETGGGRVEAYLGEADLRRVAPGTAGRFVPEDPGLPALPARVEAIDSASTRVLPDADLASTTKGGRIAVRQGADHALVPEQPVYRLVLSPLEPGSAPRTRRGTVLLDGARESVAGRLWDTALGVLVRESGF